MIAVNLLWNSLLWCWKYLKMTKNPQNLKLSLHPLHSHPGERGTLQDGASAWRRAFFHPPNPPCGYKTLFSINCHYLKQFKTVQDKMQVRINTTGTVWYTIHQSILMSCQCSKIILYKERETGDLFSLKHLSQVAEGWEVSGFLSIKCH